MEKVVIEHDLRKVDWVEDGGFNFSTPILSDDQMKNLENSFDQFYKKARGDDRLHYFIIINGDSVEIIPASQYNK